MPNYLNPTIIELDEVNFEKIDFEPGTAVFKSADFAILDAGSMQKLNITVDRDGERYIKQLQGICYVDKWAIARHDDLKLEGDEYTANGAEEPITNAVAPVNGTASERHGRGTEDYDSEFAKATPFGLSTTDAAKVVQSLNLKVDSDDVLFNTTQLEPLEYAYDNGTTKVASYRGEMRLSTRASALKRGYEFYNPYDPNYEDRAVGTGDAAGAAAAEERDAYKNVHGDVSEDGASTYEFLTEPKFKEDVVYIVDAGIKYSASSDNSVYSYALDDSGNRIVFDELPGIQTVQVDDASPITAYAATTALTQSNNIMHINITRNEREFDIGQSSEAVDQRRERGTRNLISSIVFCQMVSRLFNTGDGDANLQLQNVDFSSDKERQSGLFFVNIDDEDVQENGNVLPRVTDDSTDQKYAIGYKAWLGLVARRENTYSAAEYSNIEDGNGDPTNVQPETIAQYELRLEYLRDPDSTIEIDYDYDIDQNGQLTNDGFVLNFKRDSSGNVIYRDSSGNEGALTDDMLTSYAAGTGAQFSDSAATHVQGTLTAVNEEVKKVILGSGKDRTFTIANDILYKTLQAFNGEKRGRRALDEDGNHGKTYTFHGQAGTAMEDQTITRTVENRQPSEWFPPDDPAAVLGDVSARVNGDKLDAEVEYWNFRTANSGDDADANNVDPTYNTNEREYVPFKRNDKMMVYYTIDIFFQQKSLEEVSPEGLGALTVEGSTKVETGDVVTSLGRSPDFHNEKLDFVLEWVLTHQQQTNISKRNAAEAGYYGTLENGGAELVSEALLIQNGAHANSRKNVWVEGTAAAGEEYWSTGDKPALSYRDAVQAGHGEEPVVVAEGATDQRPYDLPANFTFDGATAEN
tara:strand:- start:4005 stop:6590 length:2586 start_codon:yes stop_codon:yes gene_type:complete